MIIFFRISPKLSSLFILGIGAFNASSIFLIKKTHVPEILMSKKKPIWFLLICNSHHTNVKQFLYIC